MDQKIKELLSRLSFFAEEGMTDKPIVEIAKQAEYLLLEMVRNPNTQRPVAWVWEFPDGERYEDPFGTKSECEQNCAGYDGQAIPLYTAPPVPSDVLMAVAVEVRTAMVQSCEAWGGIVEATKRVNLAAIADRYASKVQAEKMAWRMSKKSILALAAELVRGAECMADDETELTLEVRDAGTVQDDDGSANTGPELITDTSIKHSVMWIHSNCGEPRLAFHRGEDMDYIAAVNPATMLQLIAHIDAQQARIAELEKDAARYRQLRRGQQWSVIDGIGDTLRADELDAAIDSAMQPAWPEDTSDYGSRIAVIGQNGATGDHYPEQKP